MPKSECMNILTFWIASKTSGLVTKLILQRLYILFLHKNNKKSCSWCRQLHRTDMHCLAKLFLLTEATNKNSAAAIMPANEMRPAKQPILQLHFPIWRIALFSLLRQQLKMNETLLLRFHTAAALGTCIFSSFPSRAILIFIHEVCNAMNVLKVMDDQRGTNTHDSLFTRSDWTLVFPSYFGSLPNS